MPKRKNYTMCQLIHLVPWSYAAIAYTIAYLGLILTSIGQSINTKTTGATPNNMYNLSIQRTTNAGMNNFGVRLGGLLNRSIGHDVILIASNAKGDANWEINAYDIGLPDPDSAFKHLILQSRRDLEGVSIHPLISINSTRDVINGDYRVIKSKGEMDNSTKEISSSRFLYDWRGHTPALWNDGPLNLQISIDDRESIKNNSNLNIVIHDEVKDVKIVSPYLNNEDDESDSFRIFVHDTSPELHGNNEMSISLNDSMGISLRAGNPAANARTIQQNQKENLQSARFSKQPGRDDPEESETFANQDIDRGNPFVSVDFETNEQDADSDIFRIGFDEVVLDTLTDLVSETIDGVDNWDLEVGIGENLDDLPLDDIKGILGQISDSVIDSLEANDNPMNYNFDANGISRIFNQINDAEVAMENTVVDSSQVMLSDKLRIDFQMNEVDSIELNWSTHDLVLQRSTDLVSWKDVKDAVSPYRPSLIHPNVFYRLRPRGVSH